MMIPNIGTVATFRGIEKDDRRVVAVVVGFGEGNEIGIWIGCIQKKTTIANTTRVA